MAKNYDWTTTMLHKRKARLLCGHQALSFCNFILHEDSATFVYSAGEINQKKYV
ncbi:hypothetical protein [Prevotella intermedia]|uniref:hypothetical protein n=1 Tax=Prevotella intermedia TaxID=28131 RepID=UPI001E43FDD1|nr:hypothetical protein [Prevotella intermedia]